MNEALKVDRTIKKNYAKKYMERHRTLCVTLDNESDSDIIRWLETQENRSQTVREILRKEATK